MRSALLDMDYLFGLDKNHSLNAPLLKGPFVSECDYCGELVRDDDSTEFRITGKYVHLCPICTDRQREEYPRSEVL